ncbi:hypothetical protein PAHAL_1G114700 [Panicum hallii]|uniref:Uncharacterized protein n=1 Tax=Panicum hallii TaxID=206008 RepID=A0A2S3GNJ0_9POAL|nr:hypothetical protein PAHAL_1G114700 [Panicum hallii]
MVLAKSRAPNRRRRRRRRSDRAKDAHPRRSTNSGRRIHHHSHGSGLPQHDITGLPFAALIARHPARSSIGADASVNRQRHPCSGHSCAWPGTLRLSPTTLRPPTAAGRQAGGANAVCSSSMPCAPSGN